MMNKLIIISNERVSKIENEFKSTNVTFKILNLKIFYMWNVYLENQKKNLIINLILKNIKLIFNY